MGQGVPATGGRRMAQRLRGLVWIALLSSLVLASLAVWARVSFGSLGAALAFARGARLLPDEFSKSFGTLEAGEEKTLVFNVSNWCNQPIKILGAHTSCTCISAEARSLVIPPGADRPLQVTVRSASRLGAVSESVLFYTDYPRQLRLVLSVRGRVVRPGIASARGKEAGSLASGP